MTTSTRHGFPPFRIAAFAIVLVAAVVESLALPAGQQGSADCLPPFTCGVITRGVLGPTPPSLESMVFPTYSAAARRAGIEGEVEVEAVVLADGRVGDTRVAKSLDAEYGSRFGLDAAALAAVKQWRFAPGLVRGQRAPVIVTLVVTFRLAMPSVAATRPGDEFTRGAYGSDTRDLVAPTPLHLFDPRSTTDAQRFGLHGEADVEVVVDPHGTVARARIVKSLDVKYGLDDEALVAARDTAFTPGTLHGTPVSVVMTIPETFRLH